ncbi:hypothetical protein R3P38DRAFT_2522284 [Favolaschia claudopus]|uniref:Transmembrane protein n=1 Tax=Favolaschia claudopus TaxID=2862362 RepID=A0AAW0BWU0_9AGAR
MPLPQRQASVTGLPPPVTSDSNKSSSLLQRTMFVVLILSDFIPGQFYLHFLLRIPSLYFSRVTRIFEDARLSLPDIKRMACAKPDQWELSRDGAWQTTTNPDPMPLPSSLLRFRSSWESFIDALLREWKTFNIISVLLMSAILTMLQIEQASHPVIRTSALFSLICALMSLLFGCMFIIRFETMRKMHKASSFANEAQKQSANVWWNIWVLLAMPAVWLAWSIIMFLACIMSFIWLTGSSRDSVDVTLSARAALGSRIALTLVFALGVIYFVLIVRTFHRYGDPLDREWTRTLNEWTREALTTPDFQKVGVRSLPRNSPSPSDGPQPRQSSSFSSQQSYYTPSPANPPHEPPHYSKKLASSIPLTSPPSAFFRPPDAICSQSVAPSTVMQLRQHDVATLTTGHTNPQWADAITSDDFDRFILDISSAWKGQLALVSPKTEQDLPTYTLIPPAQAADPGPPALATIGPGSPNLGLESSQHMNSTKNRRRDLPSFNILSTRQIYTTRGDPDLSAQHIPPDPIRNVKDLLDLWNECYFHPRNLLVSLVQQDDTLSSVILAPLKPTSGFHHRDLVPLRRRDLHSLPV